MAARIVIEPVVVTDSGTRMPLHATLVDPGRPAGDGEDDDGNPITIAKHLVGVSAISSGLSGERNHDTLSVVAGADLSNLDTAEGVVTLFETGSDQPLAELRQWLTTTPNALGWSAAKRNRIITRLTNAGADITGITGDTPLWQIVNRLGDVWSPGFDVREIRTYATGA